MTFHDISYVWMGQVYVLKINCHCDFTIACQNIAGALLQRDVGREGLACKNCSQPPAASKFLIALHSNSRDIMLDSFPLH